jgi:seryl-tRNA synthetase
MLDIKFIRENPDLVTSAIRNKNEKADVPRILELDEKRREIIAEVERLKAERNAASAEIAKAKKAGQSADEAIVAMRELGQTISSLDDTLRETESKLHDILIWVPNIPHPSVPVGAGEDSNKVLREWGTIDKPDFEAKPHWELGEQLGILDLESSARVSGAGYYILKGLGARLERALVNYMLDVHAADGYTEVVVPHLVTEESMFGTGQLPKLDDDMYRERNDGPYLIPTAEVPMTNMYRDQIVDLNALPINLVAHTPCYRREAGAAGKDTRGMIRLHQFAKVELVKIVRPEDSYDELEVLLAQAEKIIKGLGIPYRASILATGDLSFASAKTYDIEIWSAGVQRYLEISSVSIFEDFQARRMNCRFRDADKKVKFPHTLNGSGVALARLVPAILENFQQADGSVLIPEVIRPYMGGIASIT